MASLDTVSLAILLGSLLVLAGILSSLIALRFGVVPAIIVTVLAGTLIFTIQGAVIGTIGANPIIVTIGAGAIQEGVRSSSRPRSPSDLIFISLRCGRR